MDDEFASACKSGDLEFVKKIPISDILSINFDYLCKIFLETCNYNNYEIAQYIYQLKPNVVWDIYDKKFGKYNHLRNKDTIFTSEYNLSDVKFVEFIYKIHPNIKISKTELYLICLDGHLDIFQWLYDNVPVIRKHEYLIKAFSGACESNHLEIVEWIYKLNIINNDLNIEKIITDICWHGCIEVFNFLYANMPNVVTFVEKSLYLNVYINPIIIPQLISLGCKFNNYKYFNRYDIEQKRALIPVLDPKMLDAEGLDFYLKETNNVLPYLFDGAPEYAKLRGRNTKPAIRE